MLNSNLYFQEFNCIIRRDNDKILIVERTAVKILISSLSTVRVHYLCSSIVKSYNRVESQKKFDEHLKPNIKLYQSSLYELNQHVLLVLS